MSEEELAELNLDELKPGFCVRDNKAVGEILEHREHQEYNLYDENLAWAAGLSFFTGRVGSNSQNYPLNGTMDGETKRVRLRNSLIDVAGFCMAWLDHLETEKYKAEAIAEAIKDFEKRNTTPE